MDDRGLGHAVALVALHSVAETFERAADAERREEERQQKQAEAEERRERKEEAAQRRRAAMARLAAGLGDEALRVMLWTVFALVALMIASVALTFAPGEGAEQAAFVAAWQTLWLPLAISAGIAWIAGLGYDLAAAARGERGWAAPLLPGHVIMGIAVPVILIGASVEKDYVPPQIWSLVPYASVAGFVASLIGRYLWYMPRHRERARFAVVALCLATGAAGWFVSMLDFLPDRAVEAKAQRQLKRQVSIGNCDRVPLRSLPRGLLRDSLNGMTRCRQRGITGKFYAFSGATLFDLHVSRREAAVGAREERHEAEYCASGGGTYSSEWWEGSKSRRKPGYLFCYGEGDGATIEWSDKRTNAYLTVRGRGRQRLYRWWRENG